MRPYMMGLSSEPPLHELLPTHIVISCQLAVLNSSVLNIFPSIKTFNILSIFEFPGFDNNLSPLVTD